MLTGTLYGVPIRVLDDHTVDVEHRRVRRMVEAEFDPPFGPADGFFPHALADRLRERHGDAFEVEHLPDIPDVDPDVVH